MKKNNYNWNLNPDNLSPEEIAKHKDFDALLKKAVPATEQVPQKAPTIRRLYYIGGAVAAALIGILFYTVGFGTGPAAPIVTFDEYAAAQPYVNPPIETIQKAFNSQSIDVNKGGVYEYDNGSKVTVPAGAFTDRYGNLAVGQVDIKYKEYHDYVDFFLSGIPLEYDSAGTKYFLESAGMIEIYAEQNGERLEMTPGKTLDVELVSSINVKKGAPLPSFNIYSLDTEARNWVYEGVDQITLAEEPAADLLSEEDEILQEKATTIKNLERKETKQLAAIEASLPKPVKPYKPMKKNGTDQAFNFDIAADQIKYGNEVPTAAQEGVRSAEQDLMKLKQEYGNTVWQVSPNNGPYEKEAIRAVTWDDMNMRHLKNQDYELKLIKGDKSVKLIVNPVLNGADYEAALAKFNAEQTAYLAKLDERSTALAQKKAALREEIEAERALFDKKFDERIAAYRAKGQENRATDELISVRVINNFTATSLGIWNCDRPIPPSIYTLKGEFKGSDNSEFDGNIAYLVDKQRNSVARFYTQKGTDLQFNMKSDNLLWLVTEDNKFAIYPPEEFKKINTKFGEHTFVMNVDDRKIETEEDIREILNF